MNIILKNNEINTKNIYLNKFNNIIYKYNDIELLGIPLKISNIDILDNNKYFYKIKCNNKNDLDTLNKINNYFYNNYRIYPFIKDNTIFVNKNDKNYLSNNDFVHINIKSLRSNNKLYLYIYLL